MPLKSKRSPAEGEFLFEMDEHPTEERLTAFGGPPLFVRTARSLDVPGSVKRNLAWKRRDRGFDEATGISFTIQGRSSRHSGSCRWARPVTCRKKAPRCADWRG